MQQKQEKTKAAQKPAISPTRAENYAEWYQSVVREAELAEMAHVRGCMVIKPWGFGIWEQIKARLDRFIQETGHENLYFPMFIPLKYIEKEAAHVAGFAKEMAVVTHHRLEMQDGKLVPAGKLEEPVVVRPTSETIIGESFRTWIESYRDLPLLINQWANVVRWELRPRVFLRTTEFLWQEGHTAHATQDEAMDETTKMHRVYETLAREWVALPVIAGRKPASERFPGAEETFTIEAMMQDGKALQAGTSHYLGQNFAQAAGMQFLDRDGQRKVPYTTSWGLSTRMVGAIIMAHSDDNGLRVPPRLAPLHVVINPVSREDQVPADVLAYCHKIAGDLRAKSFGPGISVTVRVDERQYRSVDKRWKWIKKGVPLLLEIGAKDMANDGVTCYARHESPGDVRRVGRAEFVDGVGALLDDIQAAYYRQADERMNANIRRDITDLAGMQAHFGPSVEGVMQGFVAAKWCESPACEEKLHDLSVTIRCLPLEQSGTAGRCVVCGEPATVDAVFGKSY